MDKNELYRIKDELLKSKAQDLEQIEDNKKYSMRANELRAMQEQQMKHEAMGATEQSEMDRREMMKMGNEKPNVSYNNITQEIKKHNR